MKNILYFFQFLFVIIIFFFFKLIPLKTSKLVASIIFRIVGKFSSAHKTAIKNCMYVFPNYEGKLINSIIDKSGDTFLDRIYTETEQEYCNSNSDPSTHYAGRFAAKEAVKKAIMSSGTVKKTISLKSIEINRKANGEPFISTIFKNNDGNIKKNIELLKSS